MTREIIIGCWLTFRAGEPSHLIVWRVNTILLTGCGLHFNDRCGKASRTAKMCGNCRKNRRDAR